jgi:hypothetical protein
VDVGKRAAIEAESLSPLKLPPFPPIPRCARRPIHSAPHSHCPVSPRHHPNFDSALFEHDAAGSDTAWTRLRRDKRHHLDSARFEVRCGPPGRLRRPQRGDVPLLPTSFSILIRLWSSTTLPAVTRLGRGCAADKRHHVRSPRTNGCGHAFRRLSWAEVRRVRCVSAHMGRRRSLAGLELILFFG